MIYLIKIFVMIETEIKLNPKETDIFKIIVFI